MCTMFRKLVSLPSWSEWFDGHIFVNNFPTFSVSFDCQAETRDFSNAKLYQPATTLKSKNYLQIWQYNDKYPPEVMNATK